MRAIVAGVASGVAAAVGVLLAFCANKFLTLPAPDSHGGTPVTSAGYAFVFLVSVLIVPTLALGSLVGGIVLAPYAYLKSKWSLDWIVDMAVFAILFVPGGFLFFRRIGNPPIDVTVNNTAFLLSGALIGLLPLKLLVR